MGGFWNVWRHIHTKVTPKLAPGMLASSCFKTFDKHSENEATLFKNKLMIDIWMIIFSINIWLSHVMRKPVLSICEQQRCRSACASAQSDQHLCCSLLSIIPILAKSNISRLAGLCSWAGRFESYLVGNPEDRFSHDEAHIQYNWILTETGQTLIERL